jgi:hypothetical protein
LIDGTATGTRSGNKPIRQKGALLHIEQLLDIFFLDKPRFTNRLPNFIALGLRFCTVRAAVMIELNSETGEISLMSRLRFRNDFFFSTAFGTRSNHDRGAMRIVGTNVQTAIASKFLESHPDIGLQVFNQMPNVDRTIRVGQCGSGQDSSFAHQIRLC